MHVLLVLLGIAIVAACGVPELLASRVSRTGQWFTTFLAVTGAAIGLTGIGLFWITGDSQPITRPWQLFPAEFRFEFSAAMDGLSAIFLLPIFLISLLGNVYGLGYWKPSEHPENGRK